MRSSRLVVGALVVLALAVGVVVGLAAPRDGGTSNATPSSGIDEISSQLAEHDAWLADVSTAAIAGRLDGLSVAVLVADGAPSATVDQVTSAITDAGGSVGVEATMSADWWTPDLAAFRAELADQMAGSVVGAEGLPATQVLQDAIVQALIPAAVPAGVAPTTDQGGSDLSSVLLEILTRSGLVNLSAPASGPVDALVIVAGDGPEGAGTVADLAASEWERYMSATLVVVAGKTDMPSVAEEAMAHGQEISADVRPSIVVAAQPALVPAQVVFALTEQFAGGSGTYGTAEDLPLIAKP